MHKININIFHANFQHKFIFINQTFVIYQKKEIIKKTPLGSCSKPCYHPFISQQPIKGKLLLSIYSQLCVVH